MYVEGYVIPVPAKKREEYRAFAEKFSYVLKDHGGLEMVENWEANVPDGKITDFRHAVKATADERIVFAWIIWPDRETADAAHKPMFEDPRLDNFAAIPFDSRRMIQGGFETIFTMGRNHGQNQSHGQSQSQTRPDQIRPERPPV